MTLHKPSLELWSASTRQVAEELDSKFPRPDWTSTYPGHGDDGPAWAIDLMCNKADGDRIAEYVWANRERLGVWYVIWYGRIISQTRPGAGWQRYFAADDPNPSKSHKNHVHVSRYKGAAYSGPAGKRAKETKGATKVTLYVLKDVDGYDASGKKSGKLKKDAKVSGHVDRDPFGDGRYLHHGDLYFPLDSGDFSHSKGGTPVGQKKAAGKPSPKPAPAKPKAKAGYFIVGAGPKKGKQYKYPNPIDSAQINKCARKGWFSKHTYTVQHFLNRAGFRDGHSTGYWDKATQEQYDKFRSKMGYKGADAVGAVGPASLWDLVRAANSPRKVK